MPLPSRASLFLVDELMYNQDHKCSLRHCKPIVQDSTTIDRVGERDARSWGNNVCFWKRLYSFYAVRIT